MSFTWREAGIEDLGEIIRLLRDDILGQNRETAPMSHYRDAFHRIDRQSGNMVVVGLREHEIVATYQLTIITGLSLAATTRAQIEAVRIRSDLRGEGLGSALLSDVEARARSHGATLLQLTTNTGREASQRFYERHGFTPSHVGFKRKL